TGLCWSRGTAAVINLNLAVLLVPMCRAIFGAVRRPGSVTWLWTLLPLCIYTGDMLYRFVNRQYNSAVITSATLLQGQILELQIRKDNFKCRPGQVKR
ncbi:hypothetical protein LSH36_11g06041, partial [Paralvinella palmiformis]